ncbi:hypothetical protein ASG73_03445 [Janibacter sp. Soil728]|uniref:ABC transporter substrate-binding protein n=1 Tax=Janibacter sp. Soil728 TaxID=1736393 RepID=UPI0006FCAEEB|nr:ABC transporter substrate-binding protein [Janibacter sp. Soil728]KRE39390.1 hypothetical protein ASG73_03445 [Janibacter sp. Soil728]
MLAVSALTLSGCGGSDAPSKNADGTQPLRVTMVPGVSSLPIKVAMEKGYFKDEGLEIDLTEGLEVSAWQSAAGKQFDIVFTNSAVYAPSLAKGLDNTLINNTTNASDDYVSITLATKDKIKSLKDLKGKRIGAPTLTGLTAESLKYLMAEAGVKPTEYEIVQMPYSSHPDNLKSGNIDAALTANPYYGSLERAGMNLWGKDLAVEAHKEVSAGKVTTASSSMYAANTKWVQDNPDLVNAWLDGLQKGVDDVNKDEAGARAVLQKWLKMPDQLAKDAIIPEYTLENTPAQHEATWNVLKANGTIKGDYPEDKIKVYEPKD